MLEFHTPWHFLILVIRTSQISIDPIITFFIHSVVFLAFNPELFKAISIESIVTILTQAHLSTLFAFSETFTISLQAVRTFASAPNFYILSDFEIFSVLNFISIILAHFTLADALNALFSCLKAFTIRF